MTALSSYILTKNSEKYLAQILEPLSEVSDEIIVLDSESRDRTEQIAQSYTKVKFIVHPFDNFRDQRISAENYCSYDMILFLDSDEIPDHEFIQDIKTLKETGFQHDVYEAVRNWYVLGKSVSCVYPVLSPDTPIRLYNRKRASFHLSPLVHEAPTGFASRGRLKGSIRHMTFESKKEIQNKLNMYTDIAARDLIIKNKNVNLMAYFYLPVASFIKWYFYNQGYKDGYTGFLLGKYAFEATRLKYKKARKLAGRKN